MKTMGWRFIVVTDAGEKTPAPVPADKALESPAFQKGDSASRGLKLLMDNAGDAVKVEVLSADSKELVARFREAVFTPETQTLKEPPISLIVADCDFSHQSADLAALTELADMAKVLQCPLVAQASPAFFGLKQLNLLPKLDDLPQRLTDSAHAGWQRFQKQEGARWVTLMLNRYLQRAPSEGEKPETYLWGRSVWILAAAAARSIRESGHALDLSGVKAGRFSGMPTREYPKAANQTVPLAVEVAVPEQLSLEISRAGFVALVGTLGSDSVMIPIAVNTYRSAPGKLTVSGTLGYQLLAGRLAQYCGFLLDEMPSGPDAVGFLQKSLLDFLGPLAGPAPDAAVKVTQGPGVAEVTVQPAARIEGMEFKFVFQLPIRA